MSTPIYQALVADRGWDPERDLHPRWSLAAAKQRIGTTEGRKTVVTSSHAPTGEEDDDPSDRAQ